MQKSQLGTTPVGASSIFALLTTWVFALLPANLVPSIVEKLVYELGVDITTAGFVATGMTLANAVAVFASRRAVQRGNRVLIARAGLVTMILAFASGAALPIAGVTMVALILGGLGSGLVISAATAAVSATANPDRATAIVMIINRVVVTIAFLSIPLLGGGIRELFLILAVPGILGVIGATWLPKLPEETAAVSIVGTAAAAASAGDAAPPTAAEMRAVRRAQTILGSTASRSARRAGWILAIGFGLASITDDGVYGLVGVLVGESSMQVSDSFVPTIFALSVFCGLLGALVAPVMHKTMGRTASLLLLLGVSALAKLGLMLAVDPVLYSVSSAVWGLVFGAMLPLVFGLAASLSRDGGVSVLVNGIYIVGVALGPLVATQLFDRFGTGVLAGVMTPLAIVSGVLIIIASQIASRQSATHEPLAPAVPTASLEKIGS